MDDRVAKALLENNFLDRQKKTEADVALLQKLAANPAMVLMELPVPGELPSPENCCVYHPAPLALGNSAVLTSVTTGLVTYDPVAGVIYTANFLASPPVWVQMNGGLTSDQYTTISSLEVCPNGTIYISGGTNGLNNHFIAWSPAIGEAFTIIMDQTDLDNSWGVGGVVNTNVGDIACNPLVAESVMFITCKAGSDFGVWLGSRNSFSNTLFFTGNGSSGQLSFGQNTWLYTMGRWAFGPIGHSYILNAGGTAVIGGIDMPAHTDIFHARSEASANIVHYGTNDYIYVSDDNDASAATVANTSIRALSKQELATDPTATSIV